MRCVTRGAVGQLKPLAAHGEATAHSGNERSRWSRDSRIGAQQEPHGKAAPGVGPWKTERPGRCRPGRVCWFSYGPSPFFSQQAPGCSRSRAPRKCGRQPFRIRAPSRGMWLRGHDSNVRPGGYEPPELPDCSTSQKLVGAIRRSPYRRGPEVLDGVVLPQGRHDT